MPVQTYGLEAAKPGEIIGRLIGTGNRFICIAEAVDPNNGQRYVLGLRLDGKEYVTWGTGPGADDTILMYWGHYFPAADWEAAFLDLGTRAAGW